MKSLKGHLLIAAPELADPNFFHAVVLLIEHNEEGAVGLVLNRPSKTSIRDAWEQVRGAPCEADQLLYVGGPCQGPLTALHARPMLSDNEVVPGVYASGDPDSLERLVDEPDGLTKFFVGCAGWGEGQLEGELEEDAWLACPAGEEVIFGSSDHLWERVRRQVANRRLISTLRIKHVPDDPGVN